MGYQEVFEQWKAKLSPSEFEGWSEKQIEEAFYTPLSFGTAGMRGIVGMGTNRMNIYTVARATLGLADYICDIKKQSAGVAISYDTRRCSREFALLSARVLGAKGIKVYLFENVRPVPMISFAVRDLKCAAGIMITASHNPKEYNGYKVYGDDGAQMSPEATAVVVDYIDKHDYFGFKLEKINVDGEEALSGLDMVKISKHVTVIGKSVDERYFAAISALSLSPEAVERQRNNLNIVYTPLHGSGYMPVTTMLERMKIPFTVVEKQAKPDTEFSTVSVPNPEQKDALSYGIKLAESIGGNVVIGTDPDCDRMGVAIKDDDGNFVLLNGNQIGALLMDYILRRHTEKGDMPANPAVVKTIVTTSFAKSIAESYGATVFDVLTGFKFIGEKIKEWEADGKYTFMFGYEESYGYLSGTHARDKDAVVASMLFAEMVCYWKDNGKELYDRLQELFAKFGYYRDKSTSLVFSGVDGLTKIADIMTKLHDLKLTVIENRKVAFISDYEKRVTTYPTGEIVPITLPKSNVIYYGLEGGGWLCVRPSGTEPKLKIYVSICADSMENADKEAESLIAAMRSLMN